MISIDINALKEYAANSGNLYHELVKNSLGNDSANQLVIHGLTTSMNLFTYMIRMIVWWLISLATAIVNAFGDVVKQLVKINPFTMFHITHYFNHYKAIDSALFILFIVITGIMLMFAKNPDLRQVFMKLFVITLFMIGIVPLMSYVTQVASSTNLSLLGQGRVGDSIVASQIVDMTESINDGKPMTLQNDKKKYGWTNQELSNMLWMTGLPWQKVELDKNKSPSDQDQQTKLNKSKTDQNWHYMVYNGGTQEYEDQKYGNYALVMPFSMAHYSYNGFALLVEQLIVACALMFGLFKFTKIWIFELTTGVIMSAFFVVTATKIEKVWKVLNDLLLLVITSMVIIWSIEAYLLIVQIANQQFVDNALVLIIIEMAGAIWLIGGSEFWQKQTGMDAGQDKMGVLSSIASIKMAMGVGKGAGNVAADAGNLGRGIDKGINPNAEKNHDNNYMPSSKSAKFGNSIGKGINKAGQGLKTGGEITGINSLGKGVKKGFKDTPIDKGLNKSKEGVGRGINSSKDNLNKMSEGLNNKNLKAGEKVGDFLGGTKDNTNKDLNKLKETQNLDQKINSDNLSQNLSNKENKELPSKTKISNKTQNLDQAHDYNQNDTPDEFLDIENLE